MPAVIGQAKRVLKRGGQFICADLRHGSEIEKFQKFMRDSGMTAIKEGDLTDNVIEALKLGKMLN